MKRIWSYVRLVRPAHWSKNAVVLAGAVWHRPTDLTLLLPAIRLAFAFSLVSSAVYVINDIADLRRDSNHPAKRLRPLPAGDLGRDSALGLAAILLGVALIALLAYPGKIVMAAVVFFALGCAYSFGGKQVPYLEAGFIVGGFVLRYLAGRLLARTTPDPYEYVWIVTMITFLVCAKRFQEILAIPRDRAESVRPALAAYHERGLRRAMALSGGLSVAALVLHIASYCRPEPDSVRFWLLLATFGLVSAAVPYRLSALVTTRRVSTDLPVLLLRDVPLQIILAALVVAAGFLFARWS